MEETPQAMRKGLMEMMHLLLGKEQKLQRLIEAIMLHLAQDGILCESLQARLALFVLSDQLPCVQILVLVQAAIFKRYLVLQHLFPISQISI